MANVSQAKIPVAVPSKKRHLLDSQHLTTQSFCKFDVVFAKELAPSSTLKLTHKEFMRAKPLDVPVLGSYRVHNRAFFVPFRTVWQDFNLFLNNLPAYSGNGEVGVIQSVPTVSMQKFTNYFVKNSTETDGRVYDFTVDSKFYKFSAVARHFYKVIRSLGYQFVPWSAQSSENVQFSALPLLCSLKVYLDWFYPVAYVNTQNYHSLQMLLEKQGWFELGWGDLNKIANLFYAVTYRDDFFTSVWDRPVGPSQGVISSSYTFDDVTNQTASHSVVSNSANANTPTVSGIDSQGVAVPTPLNLTKYSLQALNALTDYIKRQQLSGSRVLERMLAEYGVALSADKLKRSYYLGSDDFPVQVGDVMSTAETAEASLGSYAGKAIAYSEGHTFECETDEFGYLVVISSIIPDVVYPDGYDYNTRHLYPLDFFHAGFDALGVRAVERGELVGNMQYYPANVQQLMTQIFGYAPRFSEYKIARNQVTGDFEVPSRNADLLGWSTQRLFDYTASTADAWLLVHSYDFMRATDSQQFNRVFGFTGDDVSDPFFVVHRFDGTLLAPMKHLYDTYEFDDSEGHREVKLNVMESKQN